MWVNTVGIAEPKRTGEEGGGWGKPGGCRRGGLGGGGQCAGTVKGRPLRNGTVRADLADVGAEVCVLGLGLELLDHEHLERAELRRRILRRRATVRLGQAAEAVVAQLRAGGGGVSGEHKHFITLPFARLGAAMIPPPGDNKLAGIRRVDSQCLLPGQAGVAV